MSAKSGVNGSGPQPSASPSISPNMASGTSGRRSARLNSFEMKAAERVVRELRRIANPGDLEGMARFGIDVRSRLGVHIPELRAMAKRIGRDQELAEQLWD